MIYLKQDIQKQILDYLMIKHIYAWRQNSGAVVYKERYGNERFVRYASINGISDILGILPDGRITTLRRYLHWALISGENIQFTAIYRYTSKLLFAGRCWSPKTLTKNQVL